MTIKTKTNSEMKKMMMRMTILAILTSGKVIPKMMIKPIKMMTVKKRKMALEMTFLEQ